jgi:superfamily II DNA or RNA helicase
VRESFERFAVPVINDQRCRWLREQCSLSFRRFAARSFAPASSKWRDACSLRRVRLVFDGGTILIEDPDPRIDPRSLPGVLWDPRTRTFRAPGRQHAEIVALLSRRGLRFTDQVRASAAEALDGLGEPELRSYQEAALEAWEGAGRRGLVALPTGSGKTWLGVAAIARTRARSLCLVPTRVLLDQWCEILERWFERPIGRLGDGRAEVHDITVATFESAWRRMQWIGDRFGLLVVDEAHHFGQGIRDEVLEMAVAPLRLGLSATPPREEAQAERLGSLIGPSIFAMSVGDLTGSYLAELETVTISLELNASERSAYQRLEHRFRSAFRRWQRLAPGGTWADFARSAVRTLEGRDALHAWREARALVAYTESKRAALAQLLERYRERRTLVFTADNATAYTIAREYLVPPFTCDIKRKERSAVLEHFRRGELRALVSARVLNEGIDVPEADVAIVVGGALGEREHVQRVGRVLRPSDGKRALVFELVAAGTMEVRHAQRRRAGIAPRRAARV